MTIIPPPSAVIDTRIVAPRERQQLVFSAFAGLTPGQALELIDDDDPKQLHRQFQADLPGRFNWYYLKRGPDVWRVLIGKTVSRLG